MLRLVNHVLHVVIPTSVKLTVVGLVIHGEIVLFVLGITLVSGIGHLALPLVFVSHLYLSNDFFDEVSDLSLENLPEHVISKRNGVVLEAIDGVRALLDDLGHKLLGDAFYDLLLGQLGGLLVNVFLIRPFLGPLPIIDGLYRLLKHLADKAFLEEVSWLHVTIHQNLVDHVVADPFHCLGSDLSLVLSLSIPRFLLRILLELEFRRRRAAIVIGLMDPGLRAEIAVRRGTARGHHVVYVRGLGTNRRVPFEVP